MSRKVYNNPPDPCANWCGHVNCRMERGRPLPTRHVPVIRAWSWDGEKWVEYTPTTSERAPPKDNEE